MAGITFTRDEVILALDILYSPRSKSLNVKSPELIELSNLLNRLPIHKQREKSGGFRTAAGILQQLRLFRRSLTNGEKHKDVGMTFYEVAMEFEESHAEMHKIAESIRKNEDFFVASFGNATETLFPEGALLGQLHCAIERKAIAKRIPEARCQVCSLQPSIQYKSGEGLLQPHLVIPLTEMDGSHKYSNECYMTVCPNCHTALHRYRPWLTKENCGDILR